MRESWSSMGTRFRPDCTPRAKVAKLCITPLGVPVVPELCMMVASSPPSRSGRPGSSSVRAQTSSQPG